jgi:iron-sulfur cluster assembly accessory protein
MFKITDSAARQFQASINEVGDDSLSLRITAKKSPDSGMVYNMGLDKPSDEDVTFTVKDVDMIVSPISVENVKSMTIDFRDFEGQEQFVFMNPNDQKSSCGSSHSGCDSDGDSSCGCCSED